MEETEKTAPYETEDLQAGWAAKTPLRPQLHAHLNFGAKTDLGHVRENNEDKFDFMEPNESDVLARKGRVYAVADGMGGHSAGQIAAELSLNVFIRAYYADKSPEVERGLTDSVREANEYVVDVARTVPGRQGMGATLTAVALRDDDLFIAQVGDSRCYLLREGKLEQLTVDHSWVQEQVSSGAMSLEDAEQSPFRNVITRSMGGAPEVEPDVTAVKVKVGDRFLLCSDGLSGMIPGPEIAMLLGSGSPSAAVWNLIDRANAYGGKDNITALILEIAEIVEWPYEEGTQTLAELAAGGNGARNGNGSHDVKPIAESEAAPVSEAQAQARSASENGGSAQPASPVVDEERAPGGGIMRRLFKR